MSKMRVKLAVHTLSAKVAEKMEQCDKTATVGTRSYITACDTFWNVFNNPKPMRSINDGRITELNEVLRFFSDWQDWLAVKFKKIAEQTHHFIAWETMSDLKVNI